MESRARTTDGAGTFAADGRTIGPSFAFRGSQFHVSIRAPFVFRACSPEEERFSPGERYGRVYQINYLRCIFCGLCIEACPTRALTMTNFYELADDNRADLIYTKDQLLAPVQPGMLTPPFPMADGMEERDYYLGKVSTATDAQREYVERHTRHTDEAEVTS